MRAVEEGLPPSLPTSHLRETRDDCSEDILFIVSKGEPNSQSRPSAREAAAEIARVLREHGHVAYFAGGCVRDQLLGIEPKDFDVATTATPAEIQSLFRRTHGVGQAFGVVLVVMLGHSIEVTTFRAEGGYSDGRHPDQVRYAGPDEDARRRDFTINGLFQDPATGNIIDLVGGQDDLKRGLIRAIGDAKERLREDRLRMLRAIRFAARFGFAIDRATETAIRENLSSLDGVSRERIGLEMEAMLTHPSRANAAGLLQRIGLDSVVLRETSICPPLLRLGALPATARYSEALAAWWLDRHGEDSGAGASPRAWRESLVLSNEVTDRFLGILDIHRVLSRSWDGFTIAQKKRTASRPDFSMALHIFAGDHPPEAARLSNELSTLQKGGLSPAPLIDGQDLLNLGLHPGPAFSRILHAVYDAQLEGRVKTVDEASEMARKMAAANS